MDFTDFFLNFHTSGGWNSREARPRQSDEESKVAGEHSDLQAEIALR